jgi:hypothetical protein
MKTLEEIKAMRDELARGSVRFDALADTAKIELNGLSWKARQMNKFKDGFDAALELMLEREDEHAKTVTWLQHRIKKLIEEKK